MYYSIRNTISGQDLGTYGDCATLADALDMMAASAGYADYADLCASVPALPGEIAATETDPTPAPSGTVPRVDGAPCPMLGSEALRS